jgi:hypothetical protein
LLAGTDTHDTQHDDFIVLLCHIRALTAAAGVKVKDAEEAATVAHTLATAHLRKRAAAVQRLRASTEVLQASRAALAAAGVLEHSSDEVSVNRHVYQPDVVRLL